MVFLSSGVTAKNLVWLRLFALLLTVNTGYPICLVHVSIICVTCTSLLLPACGWDTAHPTIWIKEEIAWGKNSWVIPVGRVLPTAQMSQHCHNCDLSNSAVQGWKGNLLVVSISQELVYFIIMSQAVCTWAKQEHNCDSPREQWKLFCYMYVLQSNTFEAQYDWKGEWPETLSKTTYTYFACKLYSHLPESWT